MNKNNNKLKGFALTNLVLAIALGSVATAGTVLYFHNIDHQEDLTTDASLIVKEASFTQNQTATSNFVGQTFEGGTTTNGVVSVPTSAKNCAQLQAKLSPLGSASCSGSGVLTYQNQDKLNALVAVNQPALVAGSADTVQKTPVAVSMSGTVSVASVASKPATGSTSSTFKSTGTTMGSSQTLSGTSGGSVSSGSVLTTGAEPISASPAVGTATVDPPTPADPVPSAPKVLYSMWGVNAVISPVANASSFQIGIECPSSNFNSTVQNVVASGLTSGTVTQNLNGMNVGVYFLPVGTSYTVIGSGSSSSSMTAVENMTKALPQSACEMGGGYGGVYPVNIRVRACNASGQCSAWSADYAQFCEFNRC